MTRTSIYSGLNAAYRAFRLMLKLQGGEFKMPQGYSNHSAPFEMMEPLQSLYRHSPTISSSSWPPQVSGAIMIRPR